MKLLKPDWVHHNQKGILSIDVHPDGTRFVTGGQGKATDGQGYCGLVVVWNLEPVISSDAEANNAIPKVLCRMDNHLSCVNSVRWSANGLLASAGDDKIVMLWKRTKEPTAIFGNDGITEWPENYKIAHTLRAHNQDILDLAWSPQDQWLASCSVDNTIIVWDMKNLPLPAKVLRGHNGMVKGVTWDPLGKYLASQSSDQSVKIWRTSDWGCESTITTPFEKCSATTYVLRLSWSPDGQYLVTAHAKNGPGTTAKIIERVGWDCNKDFVGHRNAVTCVRFHPSIVKRYSNDKNKEIICCCLAVGSRDKSVSVWTTDLRRPLLVVHDLFTDSVQDLSWSTDRQILLACSKDGTVACIVFREDEMGTFLSVKEKNDIYERTYGSSDLNNSDHGMIIEYPETMPLVADTHFSKSSSSSNHIDVAPNIELNSASMPAKTMPQTQSAQSTPTNAILKQKETRTADGRRRITPMYIPPQEDVNDPPSEPGTLSSSSGKTSNIMVEMQMNDQMLKGHAKTSPIRSLETQRIAKNESNGFQLDSRLTKMAPVRTISIGINSSSQVAASSTTAIANTELPHTLVMSDMRKAKPYTTPTEKINGANRVEIQNGFVGTAYGKLAKITCVTAKTKSWESFAGSPIVSFCICAKYVLVCCLDGTIQFIDIKTGLALLPKLKMLSPAVQCVFSMNSELGGIVTECGLVRIWNLTTKEIFLSTNCHDLLSTTDGSESLVTFFHVTESGVVFVLLGNGCAYSYCKKLDSWVTLNSSDPVTRHGISSQPHNSTKCMKSFPLGSIQSASQSFRPISRDFTDHTNGAWRNAAKLQFIDDQIKICEAIKSPAELEFWYASLGMHLAHHGTKERIRILLNDLLGNPFTPTNETILGIHKHKILAKVLEQLQSVPKWQRIYMEYSVQLKDSSLHANGMAHSGINRL